MVRPLRVEAAGAVYHVIARGNERKAIFRDVVDRDRYIDGFARYSDRFDFRLLAFCLMTNHLHLAIQRGSVPLSRIMLALHGSYSHWFNRRHDRVGHLFQGRYKAYLVQKDRYLLALIRYIHRNPVKARLVASCEQYAWSSDRYYRSGEAPAWLETGLLASMLGETPEKSRRAYRRLISQEIGVRYESVREFGGTIKGDPEFARRTLEIIGRGLIRSHDAPNTESRGA